MLKHHDDELECDATIHTAEDMLADDDDSSNRHKETVMSLDEPVPNHYSVQVKINIDSALVQSNLHLKVLLQQCASDQLLPDDEVINVDVLAFLFGKSTTIHYEFLGDYYYYAARFGCKLPEVTEAVNQIFECTYCMACSDPGRPKTPKCAICGRIVSNQVHINWNLIRHLIRIQNINAKALRVKIAEFITTLRPLLRYKLLAEMLRLYALVADNVAERKLLHYVLIENDVLAGCQRLWLKNVDRFLCLPNYRKQPVFAKTKCDYARQFDNDLFLLRCFPPGASSSQTIPPLLTHSLCVSSTDEFVQNLANITQYLPIAPRGLDSGSTITTSATVGLNLKKRKQDNGNNHNNDDNNTSGKNSTNRNKNNNIGVCEGPRWKNFILTGGTALSAIHKQPGTFSTRVCDVDLFLFGSKDEQMVACVGLLQIFSQAQPDQKMYVGVRGSVVYVFFVDCPFPFQIIFTEAKTAYEVVASFDLSFCQVVFDGHEVYAPIDCIQALNTRTFEIPYEEVTIHKTGIRMNRLHKAKIKGFECTNLLTADEYTFSRYMQALKLKQPDANDQYKSPHHYFYPKSSHQPDEIYFYLEKMYELEQLVTNWEHLEWETSSTKDKLVLKAGSPGKESYDPQGKQEEARLLSLLQRTTQKNESNQHLLKKQKV